VTDEDSMVAAVEQVVAAEGAVGALVNNAGYSQSGAVETVKMADVRRQFETNVFGLMRMCQLVLPGMRERRDGRIVNISSIGGKVVFPGGGVYHGTKHAVEGISDALRYEVRGFGVKVSIVEPGLIRTNFDQAVLSSLEHGVDDAGGPYAHFNERVGQATKEAYENGALARLGGGPETVAKAIEHAITARRPRIRYRVTPSAKLILRQHSLMTDRMWDAMMRTQFPQPGR
jgi:short-subunit dehydrogenase